MTTGPAPSTATGAKSVAGSYGSLYIDGWKEEEDEDARHHAGDYTFAMTRFLAILLASFVAAARAQSVYIEDLTWTEVRDAIAAGKTTAIVYAGSTEQKGPHMAIGAHNFTA